jgi:YVTN family beta-propeller protein
MRRRSIARARWAGFAAVAIAIASLGLVGATAQSGTAVHPRKAAFVQRTAPRAPAPRARHKIAIAYVVNVGSGTVTPIATATNKPGRAIRTGDRPFLIVITP